MTEHAFHYLHSPTLTGLLPLRRLRAISEVSAIERPEGYGFAIRLDPYLKPLLVGGFAHHGDAENEHRRLRQALIAPGEGVLYSPFEDLALRPALWRALQLALHHAEASLKIRFVVPAGDSFRVGAEEPEAGFYAAVNPEGDVIVVSGPCPAESAVTQIARDGSSLAGDALSVAP